MPSIDHDRQNRLIVDELCRALDTVVRSIVAERRTDFLAFARLLIKS